MKPLCVHDDCERGRNSERCASIEEFAADVARGTAVAAYRCQEQQFHLLWGELWLRFGVGILLL